MARTIGLPFSFDSMSRLGSNLIGVSFVSTPPTLRIIDPSAPLNVVTLALDAGQMGDRSHVEGSGAAALVVLRRSLGPSWYWLVSTTPELVASLQQLPIDRNFGAIELLAPSATQPGAIVGTSASNTNRVLVWIPPVGMGVADGGVSLPCLQRPLALIRPDENRGEVWVIGQGASCPGLGGNVLIRVDPTGAQIAEALPLQVGAIVGAAPNSALVANNEMGAGNLGSVGLAGISVTDAGVSTVVSARTGSGAYPSYIPALGTFGADSFMLSGLVYLVSDPQVVVADWQPLPLSGGNPHVFVVRGNRSNFAPVGGLAFEMNLALSNGKGAVWLSTGDGGSMWLLGSCGQTQCPPLPDGGNASSMLTEVVAN